MPRHAQHRARRARRCRARRPAREADVGSDNGSAFTAPAFKLVLSELGVTYRRGGYRDPQSWAFIKSWFAKLKERCVWLPEFETLDQAREVIAPRTLRGPRWLAPSAADEECAA